MVNLNVIEKKLDADAPLEQRRQALAETPLADRTVSGSQLAGRQIAINDSMGVDFSELGGLQLLSYRGEDARLANKSGKAFLLSPFNAHLCNLIVGYDLSLVYLDLTPDFFNGNENVRNEVSRFVKGVLGGICDKYNAPSTTYTTPPDRA
jgi:hypothetical protein